MLKRIKYHNIYLLLINIYIIYDLISKFNYNNIDITIYVLLYIIYFILLSIYENKKNN